MAFKRLAVVLLLAFIASCKPAVIAVPFTPNSTLFLAAVIAAAPPDSNPGPRPIDPTTCPNCDGKGWVGDGATRLKCTTCDGTGKITPRTSSSSSDVLRQSLSFSEDLKAAETPEPSPAVKPEEPVQEPEPIVFEPKSLPPLEENPQPTPAPVDVTDLKTEGETTVESAPVTVPDTSVETSKDAGVLIIYGDLRDNKWQTGSVGQMPDGSRVVLNASRQWVEDATE